MATFWVILGSLGVILGDLGVPLGCFWEPLGVIWELLGGLWLLFWCFVSENVKLRKVLFYVKTIDVLRGGGGS